MNRFLAPLVFLLILAGAAYAACPTETLKVDADFDGGVFDPIEPGNYTTLVTSPTHGGSAYAMKQTQWGSAVVYYAPPSPPPPGWLKVDFWLHWTGGAGGGRLVHGDLTGGMEAQVRLNADGTLSIGTPTFLTNPVPLTSGAWNHVVFEHRVGTAAGGGGESITVNGATVSDFARNTPTAITILEFSNEQLSTTVLIFDDILIWALAP